MSTQEDTPEDHRSEETVGEDGPGHAVDEPGADPQKPLEDIDERIDKARAKAEEAGILEDAEQERYVESGTGEAEEEDDQTIAPPG